MAKITVNPVTAITAAALERGFIARDMLDSIIRTYSGMYPEEMDELIGLVRAGEIKSR